MNLVRNGYGSVFNELTISGDEITKVAKNSYGLSKIKKEMEWYRFCESENMSCPRPAVKEYLENGYTMKYYKDAMPLYKLFPQMTKEKRYEILASINDHLKVMHSTTEKSIDKSTFMRHIEEECHNKTLRRFVEIEQLVSKYGYITHVNNMAIPSFHAAVNKVKGAILSYYDKLSNYSIACIHGDCQFNNILITPNSGELIFIDPRGYFGDLPVYGPADYDKAKVAFALSGYDVFDNMNISELNIDGNNVTIPNLFQIKEPLTRGSIETNWVISIWLGNAHCFKANEAKAMFSYFYALYLAATYL